MLEKRLEVFLAVALSRNLAKAAGMLNVTPSSVSKELKNLEEELGMLLVDRQKGVKGTKLTPAGESFMPLALKWQEIQREITSSYKTQPAFSLRMAGCETANNNLLPDIFNDMLSHNPPVLLAITTDPTDQLYERIETREDDVAFVVHQEASRLVKITPMYKDEMLVACYEEQSGTSGANEEIGVISPDDLDPQEELYIRWSQEYHVWHDTVWEPGKPLRADLQTAYLVPSLLDRKGRWSIVPKCVMRDYQNMRSNIRFYRLTTPPADLIYYEITHRNPKISAIRGLDILNSILQNRGFFNID